MIAFSLAALLCACLTVWGQGKEKDLSLEDLLNTKVDAAAKYSQKVSEAPASITVVTHADIVAYGYQTLDEVFAATPGFYTTLDRNYGFIGTRGFSRPGDYNNRILVLLNGRRINENFYGYVSVWTDLAIDLKSLERIEIIRGPGSALYGTGAMLAVINLVTKTGASIDGTEVNLRGGSYRNVGADLRWGKSFQDGSDWMLSAQVENIHGQDLYFPEFNSPETNFGIAQNLDWDKWYGFLTTYRRNDLVLQANVASREKAIPTASFETVFNALSKTLDERQSFSVGWSKQISARQLLTLDGYWNRNNYAGTYAYEEGVEHDRNIGQWLGTEARWQWDVAAANRFIAGMEYIYNPTVSYKTDLAGVSYHKNFPYSIFSVYAQDEHQIAENLAITLGLRYDNISNHDAVSPRVAVVYHPALATTFKLIYGNAFRSPNAYETNYSTDNFKTNPDIRPESIRMLEGIWQQQISSGLHTELSVYHYGMRNLIDTELDPVDFNYRFTNRSKVLATGMEISAMIRSVHEIQGYFSYGYEHADDVTGGGEIRLTNSPLSIAKAGVVVPVSSLFHVAAELRYETGRDTVYGTHTNDVFLTNISLKTFIPAGALKTCPLTFQIRNVFNADYSTPGGFEHVMPAIQQNGRNYLLDLGFRFGAN